VNAHQSHGRQPGTSGVTRARILEGHSSWVLAVALSADGKRAVSSSDDFTLRVWDWTKAHATCSLPVMLQCLPSSGRESTSSRVMDTFGSIFFGGSSEHFRPRLVLEAIEHPPASPPFETVTDDLSAHRRRIGNEKSPCRLGSYGLSPCRGPRGFPEPGAFVLSRWRGGRCGVGRPSSL
jgi:hypothetical protein